MDEKKIRHDGKVTKITDNKIFAEIIVSEACGHCQAKQMCFSKGKAMTIEAHNDGNENFEIGEEIKVFFEEKLAATGVFLAYVFPMIVFFAVMFAVIALTDSQDKGCIAALMTLPVYFFLLYKFRGKLKKTFKFRVEKK
ncbi:MAG: SoxR reducing system RseC family protein [Bacteroidales bacterium]|nr:SoxR reducing system RseC family protein [Bacteroidales bacterium]